MTDSFAPEFLGRSFWTTMPEVAIVAGLTDAFKDQKLNGLRDTLIAGTVAGAPGAEFGVTLTPAEFLKKLRPDGAGMSPLDRIGRALAPALDVSAKPPVRSDFEELVLKSLAYDLAQARSAAKAVNTGDSAEAMTERQLRATYEPSASFYTASKVLSYAANEYGANAAPLLGRIVAQAHDFAPDDHAQNGSLSAMRRGVAVVRAMDNVISQEASSRTGVTRWQYADRSTSTGFLNELGRARISLTKPDFAEIINPETEPSENAQATVKTSSELLPFRYSRPSSPFPFGQRHHS